MKVLASFNRLCRAVQKECGDTNACGGEKKRACENKADQSNDDAADDLFQLPSGLFDLLFGAVYLSAALRTDGRACR